MQAGYDRGLVDEVREEGAMGAVPMLRALNVGYAWMGCNVVCSAAYVLGMRKVIRKMGFRDWDSTFRSPSSFPPRFFFSLPRKSYSEEKRRREH